MRHQYQCRALRAVEFEHEFDDLAAGSGIEVAGGFVGEEYLGLGDEGAGECDALLFAAGEVFGQVMSACIQADLLQGDFSALARVFAAGQFQRQHDVLQGVQRGQQLEGLEHEAGQFAAQSCAPVFIQFEQVCAMQRYAAAARHVQPGQQSQQGRFAGAGGADDGEAFARCHREGNIVQNGERAIAA